MKNYFEAIRLSTSQKIALTGIILVAVFLTGFLFQYSYHVRKEQYTKKITGFYQKYLKREPDARGLKHWVTWALNKWPLEKVEQKGFAEAAEKGGPT